MKTLKVSELLDRLTSIEAQHGPDTYVAIGIDVDDRPALLGIYGNVVDFCNPIFSSDEN